MKHPEPRRRGAVDPGDDNQPSDEMAYPELGSRCARIKTIAGEIERFPSEGLVRQLCDEAEAGCGIDPRCAFWFFCVRDVALDLLSEGCWWAGQKLPAVVQMLDDVVTARLMDDVGAQDRSASAWRRRERGQHPRKPAPIAGKPPIARRRHTSRVQ